MLCPIGNGLDSHRLWEALHLGCIPITRRITNYIQYEDNYTFMPDSTQYYNQESAENILSNSTPKVHWGMVWCK
jgi:hypothetical protein